MNAYRIETVLTVDGTVLLRDLPFKPGASLEVIILEKTPSDPPDSEDVAHVADWLKASNRSLQEVWDNDEDAVYDKL
jgi:hypothetical protein